MVFQDKNSAKYSMPFKSSIIRVEAPAHSWEQELKFCIDFLLPKGTPILAANSGTVVACQDKYSKSYKTPNLAYKRNYIVIHHINGENSVYVHLQQGSIKVKKGQKVKRGQVIALSGQVGFATYPHLHFGVYKGEYQKGGFSIKIQFDKKYKFFEMPLYIAEDLGKHL